MTVASPRADAEPGPQRIVVAARIETSDAGAVEVVFQRPVRAITPGQAAVFYDGARVLGRGWIHACG